MSVTTLMYVLIFSGWFGYWLFKLAQAYKNVDFSFSFFIKDNVIEFFTSAFSAGALILLGWAVLPLDPQSKLANFMLGYGAGSILNTIISTAKPQSITPVKPTK